MCRCIALILALALPCTTMAATATAPTVLVRQVEKKYQQLHSLEFRFSQITLTGGRSREGSGSAVFYRPQGAAAARLGKGIMRWNYTAPTLQTILNDGKELTLFTPQDQQLIITPVKDLESDITYALFAGTKSLPDTFASAAGDPGFMLSPPQSATTALLLTPRQPDTQVKRVQLWLGSDLTIRRLLMEDHFGTLTELTFSEVRINGLPPQDARQGESLLHLDIPDGTEIIRQ